MCIAKIAFPFSSVIGGELVVYAFYVLLADNNAEVERTLARMERELFGGVDADKDKDADDQSLQSPAASSHHHQGTLQGKAHWRKNVCAGSTILYMQMNPRF